jgi:subtilisin-like proprotein convertase family protein
MFKIGSPHSSLIALILLFLTSIKTSAQEYVNGNLITDSILSNGTLAPSGTSWSQIQPPNVSNGTISGTDTRRSIIDDFSIPAGEFWKINRFDCYSYCTGYSSSNLPFDSLMIRIFKTDPRLPNSTPLWGDLTTNRFTSGSFSNIYRVGAAFDTSRKIWVIRGLVDTTLGEGRYWIEWILGRTPNTPLNAVPFSTLKNLPDIPGSNSLVHDLTTNTFIPITDQASGYNQDMHYRLQYVNVFPAACSGIPNPGKTISELTYACPGQRFRLSVNKNPLITGLNYVWQISTDSISWTTISGMNEFFIDTSQQVPSYYRCLVSCENNTGLSVPVKVDMQSFSFTSHPNDIFASCGEVATMKSVIKSSSPISNYQWQWKDTNGVWNNLNNSMVIKGSRTDEITFLKIGDSLNTRQFRLIIKNTCGDQLTSNPATLQIQNFKTQISPDTAFLCEITGRLEVAGYRAFLDSFTSTINGNGKLIRDTLKTGVTDTIKVSTIPAGAIITGISVKLNIRHSYIGDLSINLKSPTGKVINLLYYLNSSGGSATPNGFVNTLISSHGSKLTSEGSNPFTDFFKADLADPNGNPDFQIGPTTVPANTINWSDLIDSTNGNWILGVYDGFTGDLGRLDRWSIIFTYTKANEALWTGNLQGSIFKDSAATRPLSANEAAGTVYVKPTTNTYYLAIADHPDCPGSLPDTAFVYQNDKLTPIFNQIPDICPGDSISLPSVSLNGISGTWSPAVNNRATTTYTFTPSEEGENCVVNATMTVKVLPCNSTSQLRVFPNPATGGFINLDLPAEAQNGKLIIYDSKGAKLAEIQCNEQASLKINTQGMSAGTYLLMLNNADGKKAASTRAVILR